jgi:peptide/nickel transport system ATP-binding protein
VPQLGGQLVTSVTDWAHGRETAAAPQPPDTYVSPTAPVLSVSGLAITVPTATGRVEAVHGAAFDVARGEAVGLVGESGSGKTLTCRAVLGALPPGCEVAKGAIVFAGRDVASFGDRDWEAVHGSRLGAIFQDPASYLNPSIPVGRQVSEVLRAKKTGPDGQRLSRRDAKKRAIELLEAMGLHRPEHVYHQIPAELSGGMLQRVMIAIAVSCDPQLIVADEATTALDVTTQAEVLELLRRLKQDLGLSILFVSHDLAVVAELCERIVVFYAGEVVEVGSRSDLVSRPRHPYTEALVRVGSLAASGSALAVIPGQPPAVGEAITGCRFASRCAYATERCSEGPIPLTEVAPGRAVRCVRAHELDLITASA